MTTIFAFVMLWFYALAGFTVRDWFYVGNSLTNTNPQRRTNRTDTISAKSNPVLLHRISDSDPPHLKCQLSSIDVITGNTLSVINCQVRMDQISIDKVILNRGNCPSPTDTSDITPQEALKQIHDPSAHDIDVEVAGMVATWLSIGWIQVTGSSSKKDILEGIVQAVAAATLQINTSKSMIASHDTPPPPHEREMKEQMRHTLDVQEKAYGILINILAIFNNPRYDGIVSNPSVYKFGDQVVFVPFCNNLLEMEIDTADGQIIKYTFP